MENLLKVDDLKTYFKTHIGDVQAVRGISLYVNKGEALGIVGESGCGKSVSMMSIMKLLESNAVITSKKIIFDNIDIGNMKEKEFEKGTAYIEKAIKRIRNRTQLDKYINLEYLEEHPEIVNELL
mgnify:CR=1 FL=1